MPLDISSPKPLDASHRLSRDYLLAFLRQQARLRYGKQSRMREALKGDTRFLTRDPRHDYTHYDTHMPSFDRILQLLDKLGFEVRVEIVRKPVVMPPPIKIARNNPITTREIRPGA